MSVRVFLRACVLLIFFSINKIKMLASACFYGVVQMQFPVGF